MIPRENQYSAVALFAAFACVAEGAMDLSCKIMKRQSAPMVGLSANAMDSINYKESQTSSNFQVLDCTCDGDDDETLGFYDSDWEELDDDDKFVKSGEHDWKNSAVLLVHDCGRLEVSLTNDDSRSFSYWLDRSALILENIKELTFLKFEIGERGAGDKDNEDAFSSIYLRNVTLFDPPSPMLFEEKAEVLFERVKVDDNILDVEWTNENNKLNPIFRLEHCMFEGIDDVADGINGLSTFTFIGENKHLINDGDECALDYKGKLMVSGNHFGVLDTDAIKQTGAEKVEFLNNRIDHTTTEAFTFENVKDLAFKNNMFGFSFSQPIVKLTYLEDINGCDKMDMPISAIDDIEVMGNYLPDVKKSFVLLDFDGYDDGKLYAKMKLEDNTAVSLCDCDKEKYKTTSDDTDNEKIEKKIALKSKCQAMVDGMPLFGTRTDICEKGKMPETRSQREEKIRDDEASKWRTWLIVAILLTLFLAAAATAVIMKFCCMSSGDVSPRLEA